MAPKSNVYIITFNTINKTKINQVYVIGKYIKETFKGLKLNKKARILNNKLGIIDLLVLLEKSNLI